MNMSKIRIFFAALFASVACFQTLAETWEITMWNYDRYKNRKKSLVYAVNYAEDGDILELQNNITVTSDLEVYKDIKICSKNGKNYTIRNVGRYYICNIHPGGNLILTNIVIDCENYTRREDLFHLKPMKISGGVTNVSRLTLQNAATIKNVYLSSLSRNENAAIHVKTGAVLRIRKGAMIQNCVNDSEPGKGGAICCDFGTIVMTGGTITGCKSKGAGGAIHTDGTRVDAVEAQGITARGDIYLSGGYITNNICASGYYGGAIYLGNSGPMIHITGNVVVSNNFSGTVPDDISTYLLENAYANRLKLTGHSEINPTDFTTNGISFTGSVGVRYPVDTADPQGLRFGGQWEYFNGTQEEPRQFFWNGDNDYRGRLEGNALLWSKHVVYELPKDGEKIADIIAGGEGSPLYIELDDNYEMTKPVYVPENYQIIVDLQGFELKCDFHVKNETGQVVIRDSSVMKSGKVSGDRESESKTAFILEGGSYHTYPIAEWVATNRVLIGNYCEIHPYMVASLAWETNTTAHISDLTAATLSESKNEVRVVSDAKELAGITFSTGDWVNFEYTNKFNKVQVFAVAVVSNSVDNTLMEVGEKVLLFDSDKGLNSSDFISDSENSNSGLGKDHSNDANEIAFGREDEFVWNAMSYGYIKLLHITMTEKGVSYVTNKIEHAYIRFPDAVFEATQRKTGEQLRIILTDALLKETFNYDRATGFSEAGVNNLLDRVQANGLKKWENIVTGTADNELLLSTANEDEGGMTLNVALSNDEKTPNTETLYDVYYDIRKSTSTGWERVGEVVKTPNFTIPLLNADGASLNASGFYRVTTLIVPIDKTSVTNEIPSTNIVGVLEVASTMTNTLAAVPWVKLGVDPKVADKEEHAVTVSNYVNTTHLENDDSIQVADKGHIYRKWHWDKHGKKWGGMITVTHYGITPAAEAAEHSLSRSNSVWVTRTAPETKPFFLIGQYSASAVSLAILEGTPELPVCTLISNPGMTGFKVNDYNWGTNPLEDDLIRIPTEKEAPMNLVWNGSEWGRIVRIPGSRDGYWKNDDIIPAGTGFWYSRTGAAFEITLPQTHPTAE